MSDELRKTEQRELAALRERDAALARVRTLEAGLAEYGTHAEACEQALLDASLRADPRGWVCSCGLAALAGES